MTATQQNIHNISRRGELMAELFLQELQPLFIARAEASEFVFDYFVGFKNEQGGINAIGVEVKATDMPIRETYQLPTRTYELFEHSNVPVLLLVVNVKENNLYYAFPSDNLPVRKGRITTSIPVNPINDASRQLLLGRMAGC